MQKHVGSYSDQGPFSDCDLKNVAEAGRVSACLIGETARLGRLKLSRPMCIDHALHQLALIHAELRFEFGAGDTPRVADQDFAFEQSIDDGVHQRLVSDIVEPRLDHLSVVHGQQREFVVQSADYFDRTFSRSKRRRLS